MSKVKYIFRLETPQGERQVYPLYDDSLDKDLEMESQHVFFREKLSGKLVFVRSEYPMIAEADIEAEFVLHIDRKIHEQPLEVDWFVGVFTKTDCEGDDDNTILEVQPRVRDRYNKLMEGMNKEFNLIDIVPNRSELLLLLQPVVQVYIGGSTVVNNIMGGGVSWEQPIDEPTYDAAYLANDFYFGEGKTFLFGTGTPEAGGALVPDVSGEYDAGTRVSQSGQYRIDTIQPNYRYFRFVEDVLDDLRDFGSIWETPGGHELVYIGSRVVAGEKRWYFRINSGSTVPPPLAGSMQWLSGGIYQNDLEYTWNGIDIGTAFERFTIVDTQQVPESIVYVSDYDDTLRQNPFDFDFTTQTYLFRSLVDFTSTLRFFEGTAFVRILTNKELVNGNATQDIEGGDMFLPSGSRYKRVLGYSGFQNIVASDENADTSNGWGKIPEDAANFANRFFTQKLFPASTGIGLTYPLSRSDWSEVSWWFYFDFQLENIQQFQSTDYTIKDAYTLTDIVKGFLAELDPSLTHEAEPEYSQFLYSVNNPIRGFRKYPIFTPKDNIISGEYDQPVRRANLRFINLLNFLKDFHKLKPYVDDQRRFILEHEEYFARGMSYTTPNVGQDLTTSIEPKTSKRWAYRTSKWKYQKSQMPEQIKHKWMDDVTELFQGFPIDVISRYVQLGNIDERTMSLFTSDINLMHVAGDNIARDGFFFGEAILSEGQKYILPVASVDAGYPRIYTSQNVYASVVYAHKNYWIYQLPAKRVNLNTVDIDAESTVNTKVQDIEYAGSDDFDPMLLAKTLLGDGRITKASINLSSLSIKMQLLHATE